MRIGLLTEGGYPYVTGGARLWCDRLVRGLGQHEFDIYALSRDAEQERAGLLRLPEHVGRVRTAPLWSPPGGAPAYGRRARRRFAECYADLARTLTVTDTPTHSAREADRFANALYGLAELARDAGSPAQMLRSESAVRTLERACHAPGARQAAREAGVGDLLSVAAETERLLRPLSLDWYTDDALARADLCHAAAGGPAALPGLLARHFFGVPLLVTEYGVRLRAHYLAAGGPASNPPARALLATLHGRLAAETYRRAARITSGNAHTRRWQQRCGADPAKLRTVHPGMDTTRFADAEDTTGTEADTLVWVGLVEPAKDLVSLLHAFAEIREERPRARLRLVAAPARGPEAAEYLARCKALAAQLFPDEADDPHAVGDNPVSFEEAGADPRSLTGTYAAADVVVLSSRAEGFPVSLVEAMFCGRATVSTDTGAVVEIVGGTGLVVPPRNPKALARACMALLCDPERRARLGAAARERALELFTVEQNVMAFHGIYLEIVSRCPPPRRALAGAREPFAVPAEARVPVHWKPPGRPVPAWARVPRPVGAGEATR